MANNGSINMENAIYGFKIGFGEDELCPEKVAKKMQI